MYRFVFWCYAVAVLLLGFGVGKVLLDVHREGQRNARAVVHLCLTSNGIANVLEDAANQIDANVQAGFYKRLIDSGLMTPNGYKNALKTRDSYRTTVKELRRPGNPCGADGPILSRDRTP